MEPLLRLISGSETAVFDLDRKVLVFGHVKL
jgi:hypothetical protein